MERACIGYSGIGTTYAFQIVTKDKKVVADYTLGIHLNSVLFDANDPYSGRNPNDIDWTGKETEVFGVAEEKVQRYIARLKKLAQKYPSQELSEKIKEELKVLENDAVAIIVVKTPYCTRDLIAQEIHRTSL